MQPGIPPIGAGQPFLVPGGQGEPFNGDVQPGIPPVGAGEPFLFPPGGQGGPSNGDMQPGIPPIGAGQPFLVPGGQGEPHPLQRRKFPDAKRLPASLDPREKKLFEDLVDAMDKSAAFSTTRASGKDDKNAWFKLFNDLFDPETGAARDYYLPVSTDKVLNLKNKVVNMIWPANEALVKEKRDRHEPITEYEQTCHLQYQAYKDAIKASQQAKRDEEELQVNLEDVEVEYGLAPPTARHSSSLTRPLQARAASLANARSPASTMPSTGRFLPGGMSAEQPFTPYNDVTQSLVSFLNSNLVSPLGGTVDQSEAGKARRVKLAQLEELENCCIAARRAGDTEREQSFARKIRKLDTELYDDNKEN